MQADRIGGDQYEFKPQRARHDIEGAIDELTSLLEKIDGQEPPPDWMDDSPEKTDLAASVSLLIMLLMIS